MDHEYLLKFVHVGDSGVGKTNLLGQFSDENFQTSGRYIATIGIDFRIKTVIVDNKVVKLQLWDTAGQERFHALAKSYYRLAHGFIVCYDITRPSSFDNVQTWISEIEAGSGRSRQEWSMVLVANKLDLANEPERPQQVTERQGQRKAKELGVPFFEVSAQSPDGIEDIYMELIRNVLARGGVTPVKPLEDSVKTGILQSTRSNRSSRWASSNKSLPTEVQKQTCCY